MKKIFLLSVCLLLSSCVGTGGFFNGSIVAVPSERDRINAESYYNTIGTSLAENVTKEEIEKFFGLYYIQGDKIYSYKTFWGEKLILVRRGEAVTYVDRE